MAVVADKVEIGGDESSQVFEEGHVHGWQIVERADAHVENVAGGRGRFVGKAVHEVGVNRPTRQHARPARVDSEQVGDARLVDGDKRVEDRGDEDGTARVGC